MTELMWRGYFSDGRILFPEEGRDSSRLADCSTSEELQELVDEIYADYDCESSVWSPVGLCVVDGKDVHVDELINAWAGVDFYERYSEKINSHDFCGVYIDDFKGYSQVLTIESFDPLLLEYRHGSIYYGGEELFPEDYEGASSEIALFKGGQRVELPDE